MSCSPRRTRRCPATRSPRAIGSRRRSAIRWDSAARAALVAAVFALSAAALGPGYAHAFDRGADGAFDERTSAHFRLFQDVDIDETGGFYGSRRFEQSVLDALEGAYESLDRLLGLRPGGRIEVVVYDPQVFDRQFAGVFRFAAAGFYHGVIRIRGRTQLDTNLVRVLHHELVHAAFDAAAPSWSPPGWLNEGIAEWFEARALGKRSLSGPERAALASAARSGSLFALASLAPPSFGHLGGGAARLAYLQSYGMVEFLARTYGERRIRQLCRELVERRDVVRALRRVYRSSLPELEARFLRDLGVA